MSRSIPAVALATQKLKAGRPDEAIAPLREAALLQPLSAAIQHDLGLACLEAGSFQEAVEALRRAVALQPDYTDAHFRLGLALERLGDLRSAVVAYDRATELQPSLTEAWYRAGSIVFTLGHREEAIGCFRRAATSGRKSSFGRLGEARALLAEERDDEAERILRHSLARDPGNAVAHDLLGNVLADAGRFDEARECFARAIAAGPLMAGCYYDLVRCRRVTGDDFELLPRMQAAAAMPGLQVEQRVRVHLALGKAQDDLGDYEAAMRAFDAADDVRRTLMRFDADAFELQVERLIALFAADVVSRAGPGGRSEATPVLIMGMPRSGTTLTEQIVSSHSAVGAGGELNFWNERGVRWLTRGGASFDDGGMAQDAADYLALLGATAPGAARVTDKMPFNFLWAGLIHLALPNAVMLHCRRAAIDTALSIHQTHFNPNLAFPTGGVELVRYFRSYERLTAHWRRVLPADRFVEVDYADLTGAPEAAIRRIVAACGLDWEAACLRPELNPRTVRTPSRWQARQPIYRSAVDRWRRFEPWLGALRDLLDEDPDRAGPRGV
jgi:tetratricopeptide (TPR) repeat protein